MTATVKLHRKDGTEIERITHPSDDPATIEVPARWITATWSGGYVIATEDATGATVWDSRENPAARESLRPAPEREQS